MKAPILASYTLIGFLLCVKLSSAASDVINSRWEYSQQKIARENTRAAGEQVRLAFWHISSQKSRATCRAFAKTCFAKRAERDGSIVTEGRRNAERKVSRCCDRDTFPSKALLLDEMNEIQHADVL